MPNDTTTYHPWWQPQQLPLDACWHYRLGPLHIYLQRQARQWLLAHEYSTEDTGRQPLSQAVGMIPVSSGAALMVLTICLAMPG